MARCQATASALPGEGPGPVCVAPTPDAGAGSPLAALLPAARLPLPVSCWLPLTSAPRPFPQFWMLILATTIPMPAGYFLPIFIIGESGVLRVEEVHGH